MIFSSPVVLISSILATFWSALFQLIYGRRFADLLQFWLVGLVGFGVGQALADAFELGWPIAGQTHILEGTVACWIAMFVARWLKV